MKRSLISACLVAGIGAALCAKPTVLAHIAQVPQTPVEQDFIVNGTKSPSLETLARVERDLARTQQRNALRVTGSATTRGIAPRAFERRAGSVTVRVYFHVLTNSLGLGAVTDQQILQQIQALNVAFSGGKTLPDGTQPRGESYNTPFRFVLAGVDRTTIELAGDSSGIGLVQGSGEERDLKQRLYKGTSRDLNIYTALPIASQIVRFDDNPSPRVLGYATYPWDYVGNNVIDGVTLNYRSVPGGSLANYSQGMTAVRCIGNWLGLLSTFENGCTAVNDQVSDTPAQRVPFLGTDWRPETLGFINDTCTGRSFPGLDPNENFMDFTTDAFMYRFTRGQSIRMDSSAITYRYL